jgi:hypothetical protein
MAQQTAVEWLYSMVAKPINEWPNDIWEQAKSMEKEQIIKAFSDGQETPISNPTLPHYSREEYYNEMYQSRQDKTDK